MKLFIQIPCYNEEEQLAKTIKDLPKKITGISEIKLLIIDDGSTDKTIEVAKKNGANYIVSHNINRGLAQAFSSGIEACVKLGADIIVNTDADNQYKAKFIQNLVKPIIDNECDIVIGARPIMGNNEFSFIKKKLQKFGSFVISKLSGIAVPDATSGFRAYSKQAATKINIFSKFTYTLESIIQSSHRNMVIKSISIETNNQTRISRLFKNNYQYVIKSIFDIISITIQVKPNFILGNIAFISLLIGFIIGLRFLILAFLNDFNFINGSGYVQSLILASIFLIFGSTAMLVTFLANQLSNNRKYLEKILIDVKFSENNKKSTIVGLIYEKKKS